MPYVVFNIFYNGKYRKELRYSKRNFQFIFKVTICDLEKSPYSTYTLFTL